MSNEGNQSLFAVVAINIAELRARLEGEAGEKIRKMGDAQGTIPDLVREVVNAMADALARLYRINLEAESHIIAADAALAALEALADATEALGDGLEFGEASQALNLPAEPVQKIGEAITTGADVLDASLELMNILPRPDELRRIRNELEASLGQQVNKELQMSGVLGQLIEDISVTANN